MGKEECLPTLQARNPRTRAGCGLPDATQQRCKDVKRCKVTAESTCAVAISADLWSRQGPQRVSNGVGSHQQTVMTLDTDYSCAMGCKAKEEGLGRSCCQQQPQPSVHTLPHAGESPVGPTPSFAGLSAGTSWMQSWAARP